MSEIRIKEVDFELYCQRCKHFDTDDGDDPCNECLANGCNEYSHKPVKFEEK